jgi:hypothetical protein
MSSGFKGGAKLEAILRDTAKKLGEGKTLRVGFLETEKYPDGTPVAQVAYWNENGTATAPPRPFFRTMIAAKSSGWGGALGKAMVANKYDADAAMSLVGEGIKDQLRTSIIETNGPALSPITLMLRKMHIGRMDVPVTGAEVGEAARRVAAGESTEGASTKVLNYTGQLLRAPAFDIEDGKE